MSRTPPYLLICVLATLALIAGCSTKAAPDLLPDENVTLELLLDDTIQRDLEIKPEQRQKIEGLSHEANRGGEQSVLGRVAMLLEPNQIERVNQLSVQLEWPLLLEGRKLPTLLGFSDAQEKELLHLREQQSKAFADLFATAQGDTLETRRQELLGSWHTKMLALLTPPQREQLEAMKGKKLERNAPRINGSE